MFKKVKNSGQYDWNFIERAWKNFQEMVIVIFPSHIIYQAILLVYLIL